ncbi:hypothetical protein EMPS_10736 [Entomortierella parvispora]|uniref:Uncharacterized protein n=1 Tax=Entomortierella parvispora TaxID=205924 RepID=A0A9P3HLG8_9FUNG|nr:hypothetical protein EMPS_10736 [Entomortierella parvispora]
MAVVAQDGDTAEDLQQLFRWQAGGDLNAVQAEFDPETGKNVVFLQDIQIAYPGTFFIKDDIKVVPYLKDKSRKHFDPPRIEYLPNKVLHVVPFERPVVEYSAADSMALVVTPSNQDVLGLTAAESTTQTVQVPMNGQLLVDIAHRVEEVIDTQHRNHAEIVDMMKTTHNWLALILDRANAIFRLTYELHEYPIPRLFVILPGRSSFKDRLNPLVDKYRLYFLCECDLSASGDGGRSQPHIHFAKHDGYDLERPTEFFKKYGSYILTLLQLLRFSVAAASFAVPHIAGIGKGLEKGIEEVESAAKDQLRQKVDEAIGFLKDLPTREQVETGNSMDALDYDIEKIEALEGADLRHLASFLKNRDETQVLGNLYRLARPDGTIKWVCLDHYREEYKAIDRKHFMEFVDANNGTYYPNEGKVEMRLISKQMATQFYQQLIKARFIHELVLTLDWYTTLDDFKELRVVMDSLPTILSLTVDCCNTQSRLRDFAARGTPSSILNKVMAGHGLQSFSIRNCNEFLNQVEKLNLNNQLRKIDLGTGIEGRTQVNLISSLVKKSPRLRHLTIQAPDLPSALLLYIKPEKYQFKGTSILEARVGTGEVLTAEIRGNNFTDISLLAMDCTKEILAFSFVTKLATAINIPSDIDHLGQFLLKAKGLKEIIVQVDANLFFEVRGFIIQRGKKIRSAYFHDRSKDNILTMTDIRDPSTAEIDLLDESSDFERLLTHLGAAPRSCGNHVGLTNDILAKLEANTRKQSRISNMKLDIVLLDDTGIDSAIMVIQRSALKELSLCASTLNQATSLETSLLWKLIREVASSLNDALLRVQCPDDQICRLYKLIRSHIPVNMNGQLSLYDSQSTISLGNIQDSRTASVFMDNDNLNIPLEEFYEMFGTLPSVLGVNTLISDSVVSFLEKAIQPKDTTLKRLTLDPRVLSRDARNLLLDVVSRCSLESLDVHHSGDAMDLIVQMAKVLGGGKLTLHCTTEFIPGNMDYLRGVLSSDGSERSLRLTDGLSTIIFDNVFLAQFRMVSKGDIFASEELFSVHEILSSTHGFSSAITPTSAAMLEQWTRSFPSPYKKIRVDTSKLNADGIQNMARVISRSQLLSLTVLSSKGKETELDKRNRFLSRVLTDLTESELYVHCPIKEFAEMWELLKLHEPPDQPNWEHHLCDGDRGFVTLPYDPPKLVVHGTGAIHYEDTPLDSEDELGDTMLHLGAYVEHLNMEDISFSDKDAIQWFMSTPYMPRPRLSNLRLSTARLTAEGLIYLQKVIDRSHALAHPLAYFTLICECNQPFPAEIINILDRNKTIIRELILRGPEVQNWIHKMSTALPDRDSLLRISSLEVNLNNEFLDDVSCSWIFSMTQGGAGVRGLNKIHLGDVNQPSTSWTLFFQCLDKTCLEELDLCGSNVSELDIFAASYTLDAPLKVLNLKRTKVHPSSLYMFHAITHGRPLQILLDSPEEAPVEKARIFEPQIGAATAKDEEKGGDNSSGKDDTESIYIHTNPLTNPTWAPKLRSIPLPPHVPKYGPSTPVQSTRTLASPTSRLSAFHTAIKPAPYLDMTYIPPPSSTYCPPPSDQTAATVVPTTRQGDLSGAISSTSSNASF